MKYYFLVKFWWNITNATNICAAFPAECPARKIWIKDINATSFGGGTSHPFAIRDYPNKKEKENECLAESQTSAIHSSGWWFQTFFIFTPTWGNDAIWLIFFQGVETTNQSSILGHWLKHLLCLYKTWTEQDCTSQVSFFKEPLRVFC